MRLPELETDRLRLVIAQPGLEEALARFFRENFAGHLDRWSPPMPGDKLGTAWWQEQLPASLREFEAGTAVRWVALSRESPEPEVAGTCNLAQVSRGPFHSCVMGYQVARRLEGRGIMFEAVSAAIGHAFRELRLHRIAANYRPENVRSARLLDRLGFVREGYARDYLFIDGAWRDHVLTAKTNPGFDDAWLRG